MPQDSVVNQFLNELRAPELNLKELRRLLKEENILVSLIQELDKPINYHWNSILEAIALLSPDERFQLIEKASEKLGMPLFSYLINPEKNTRPIAMSFVCTLLNLIAEPQKTRILHGLLADSINNSNTQDTLVELLRLIEKDKLNRTLMMNIGEGVLIQKILQKNNPKLLDSVIRLLPQDKQAIIITHIIFSYAENNETIKTICQILSEKELNAVVSNNSSNTMKAEAQKQLDENPALQLKRLNLFNNRRELPIKPGIGIFYIAALIYNQGIFSCNTDSINQVDEAKDLGNALCL